MDEAGLDPSEKTLLERAVHGDVEAFSELVRMHYPAVRVYLGAQINDHGALDDLAQDVFLRAFRGLPALRHNNFRTSSGVPSPQARMSAICSA